MKPPPFTYHDPETVEETLDLLANLEDAKVLAGGQSLMPMLNMRLAHPTHLVDLNRVTGLAGIADREGHDAVRIGAMTRQRVAELSAVLQERSPLLVEALTHVGRFQTRNRGTVGGSLAHMNASAEIVAVASALDAVLHVASKNAQRTVAMADFPRGPQTTVINHDELLVSVDLPVWPGQVGTSWVEFARRHGGFAIVGAAVQIALVDDRVSRAAISLVGLGPLPVRATDIEQSLHGTAGAGAEAEQARQAAVELCGALPATGDTHAPPNYRRSLAATLVRRGLTTALARAQNRRTDDV